MTVVREFLPQAEAELKFKQLPEDEDTIAKLIDHHEVKMTNKIRLKICFLFIFSNPLLWYSSHPISQYFFVC